MGRGVRWVRGLALSCLVLGGVLVGGGLVTVVSSGVAIAQTADSIVVEGNRRVEAATVRSYFKPGPDGRLDAASINEGVKALFATGLFSDVQIKHSGGRLVVSVVENPVINEVAFEGNKKVKDAQLSAEVQSKARGTLSKPTVQADVERLVAIYRASGRFDVTVTPQIIDLPNNRVNLVFKIDEGPKIGVEEIRFVGAHAFSQGRLKDVIKTTVTSPIYGFLQTTDIYDPDRVEADRDLLRRFYLKHGYADVRIVSATGVYEAAKKGFVITFTIDEGPQYRVGSVNVISNVHALDPKSLQDAVKISAGSVYDADLVQKTVDAMTIEAAKHGYAFANVRPRADRDFQKKLINLTFMVEEGTRAYIERIVIHGNTRTRDYVIRREFDIGEGDPYNRALIDRAERRLKNLDYFKTVKITNEPGSAPDRVIVDVNVVEKPTGQFSISGGYSTANGFISQVGISDRNLLGRGEYAKASVTYGQYTRGVDLSYVEPYLLGYRMAGGIDLFANENLANNYVSYETKTYGATFRLGFALSEELSFAPHYSIYERQITLPWAFNNCIAPAGELFGSTPAGYNQHGPNPAPPPTTTVNNSGGQLDECYYDGEASMPVRQELAQGAFLTSLVGTTTTYNTLDDNKNPTSGLYLTMTNDVAGVGGDVDFIRTTAEMRNYYEVLPDVVGVLKLQGGHISSWGGQTLRMLDNFQMGPNLVRGFAPGGIGPRDLTYGTYNDALGGSTYWGASVEFQTPLYFLPKDIGIKVATFADAGSVWGYKGETSWPVASGGTGETVNVGLDSPTDIRASVGVGLIWDSPLGPLRFDLAYPLKKYCEAATPPVGSTTAKGNVCDQTQIFRFSGGTSF
jgi:outer membrane protein insertion porin family